MIDAKPHSGIASWGGWPDDVREILRTWNRKGRLRFDSAGTVRVNGIRHGLCAECGEVYVAPAYAGGTLDGKPHCDDCLIALARRWLALWGVVR